MIKLEKKMIRIKKQKIYYQSISIKNQKVVNQTNQDIIQFQQELLEELIIRTTMLLPWNHMHPQECIELHISKSLRFQRDHQLELLWLKTRTQTFYQSTAKRSQQWVIWTKLTGGKQSKTSTSYSIKRKKADNSLREGEKEFH